MRLILWISCFSGLFHLEVFFKYVLILWRVLKSAFIWNIVVVLLMVWFCQWFLVPSSCFNIGCYFVFQWYLHNLMLGGFVLFFGLNSILLILMLLGVLVGGMYKPLCIVLIIGLCWNFTAPFVLLLVLWSYINKSFIDL